MDAGLKKIKEAANGLLNISKSDFPFELIYLEGLTSFPPEELLKIIGLKQETPIEITTLEQFFHPMITADVGASEQ